MSGGTMAGRAGAVSGPRWAGLTKLVDVVLGLLVAVVVAAGVLTPPAAALDAPEEAGAAAPVAAAARGGTEVSAVLPADNILQDAWDWATEKSTESLKGVGEWLVDKGGAIASKTGEILHAVTHPVETIQGVAQDWVGSAFERAVSWVAATLGKASAWLLATTLAVVFSVSSPQMDADFLYTWSGRVFAFALPITILFALYQIIITSIQMRGLAGLRRAVGGAAFATAASMVTLPLVAIFSTFADAVKTAMIGYLEVDTDTLAQKIADLWSSETFTALAETAPAGTTVGAGAQGVSFMLIAFCWFCVFMLIFGFGLMVVMTIRNVMLYGVVVFAPLAWSGLAAEPTRGWPRTILGWIAAILVAPIAVVVVLGLGVSVLNGFDTAQSVEELVGQMTVSVGMFLIACFAPLVCFSFFNFMGEAAVASVHRGMQAGAEEGAVTVGSTVKTVVKAAVTTGAGGGGGGGGGAPAAGATSSTGAAGGGPGAGGPGGAGPTASAAPTAATAPTAASPGGSGSGASAPPAGGGPTSAAGGATAATAPTPSSPDSAGGPGDDGAPSAGGNSAGDAPTAASPGGSGSGASGPPAGGGPTSAAGGAT
ncbi:hypothetical protein, partial [Actinomyces israelii]|uniref:hypothetical protein n=1 Tax=Actinomyces israelii TaxID=1659 RepID=UPI000694FCCD